MLLCRSRSSLIRWRAFRLVRLFQVAQQRLIMYLQVSSPVIPGGILLVVVFAQSRCLLIWPQPSCVHLLTILEAEQPPHQEGHLGAIKRSTQFDPQHRTRADARNHCRTCHRNI